ncbi:MAG: (2Fe-2S) ferredoxin domain-containing protein [Cyanobacteria bacterium P01_A01_bin.40]
MIALQPLVSEFTVVGKLEDILVSSKGRVKHLYLSAAEKDYSIEVAKSEQTDLSQKLQQGCYLKVSGMKKYELHQEQLKYKAYRIELIDQKQPAKSKIAVTNAPAKILICQGSSCRQQGSARACELLKAELQTQGIADRVDIKITGCIKQCKQAPNLVIMPERNCYSKVHSAQIPKIIAKHFSA